jgi:hypothetical protein
MKVGILTVPFNNNYGGFLQAFALKTVLKKMGHDVIFINRCRDLQKIPFWKMMLWPYYKLKMIKRKKLVDKISVNTDVFKQRYLKPCTEPIASSQKMKSVFKYGIDFYVVGSDQVWRKKYAKKSLFNYFFDFLDGSESPRIAYAASFGTNEQEYTNFELLACSRFLKQFNAISVRETSAKKMLTNDFFVSERSVDVVLDPTFLLSIDEYRILINEKSDEKSHFLLKYILDDDEEKNKLTDYFAEKLGLSVVSMGVQKIVKMNSKPLEPVETWLSRIYYADFVVTDSFHGMVFSIIFNKPFFVYGNKNRGLSRFQSLLEKFHLEHRLLLSCDNMDQMDVDAPIDWKSVNEIVEREKNVSMFFLQKNVKAK